MTDGDKKSVEDMVKTHAAQLGEHFQSVQIFVSGYTGSNGESLAFEYGAGNFYARLGQVTEWLSIQDQYQRNHAIRKDNEANQ